MSRGLGRVERTILEVVQMPEFAAAPTGPHPGDEYAVGVPIDLLALYVANTAHGAEFQHLPTPEELRVWRARRRNSPAALGAWDKVVVVSSEEFATTEREWRTVRSAESSTRRAAVRLRGLGLVRTHWATRHCPMLVLRPPTAEEQAVLDAERAARPTLAQLAAQIHQALGR